MFTPIHIHFLGKFLVYNPIETEKDGKSFASDMVHAVGMKPVSEPVAVYVGEPGNEGYTGSINLATSHIGWHCWDYKGPYSTSILQFDLYSCKCFTADTVLNIIDKYFGIHEAHYTMIDRDELFKGFSHKVKVKHIL